MTKYFFSTTQCLILCSFSFFSINILADDILLKNGSHLVGKVIKKGGTILEFKTPFAGTLKIKWENIVELKIDKEVKLMLKDNSTLMAKNLKSELDNIQITRTDNQVKNIKPSQLAYINPEKWRLGEGFKTTGGLNVSLKSQHGNTDKDEFAADANVTFRRIKDRIKLRFEYENDKSNNAQTSLNWLFLGKYDYFLSDKTYLGGSALFEYDEFADLDIRETYSLYLGHQYFESRAINLSLEAGLAQVYENYFSNGGTDYVSGTWTVKYDQYFYDEFVQFYHKHLGRIALENTDKYLIKSWTGLKFPLDYGFSVSGEIQADYDNLPVQGINKLDTTYLFKLGYDY